MLHWPFSAYSIQRTPYDPKALSIRKKKNLSGVEGHSANAFLKSAETQILEYLTLELVETP